MSVGATKIMATKMVAGDKERIDRTMKILEQDVARLEKSLAERRSKEGQEATRAAILSKRAQIHRLNSYSQRAVPAQVVSRTKPIPRAHTPTPVAPKGSALLRERMELAREELKQATASPSVQSVAIQPLVAPKELPKVVDEKSLRKYNDTLEENKKIIHEMKMRLDALERQKNLDTKARVVEVPKGPALSPSEKNQLQVIPRQLAHLKRRMSAVNKNVRRLNQDGYMRFVVERFKRTRDRNLLKEFQRRGMSPSLALQMVPVKGQYVFVSQNNRRRRVARLTHPDLKNIPQKTRSLTNQLNFLRKKQAGHHSSGVSGLDAWEKAKMSAPKREPTSLTMQSIPNEVLTLVQQIEGELEGLKHIPGVNEIIEQAKHIIISNRYKAFDEFIQNPQAKVLEKRLEMAAKAQGINLGGVNLGGHAHRPYAMPRNLGIATVLKQRQLQKNNRPAIEANNMAGLRRYTAAQYARDSRVKAQQEQKQEASNLAGAFSQTRAVMERMVR